MRAHGLLRLRAAVDAAARGGQPSTATAVLLQEGPSEEEEEAVVSRGEKRPRPDWLEDKTEAAAAVAVDPRVVRTCLGYAAGVPTAGEQQEAAAMPHAAFGALLRMLAPRWAWGLEEEEVVVVEAGEQAEETSEAGVVIQGGEIEI